MGHESFTDYLLILTTELWKHNNTFILTHNPMEGSRCDAWYYLQHTEVLHSGILIGPFRKDTLTINLLAVHCNSAVAWPYVYLEPPEGFGKGTVSW